MRRASHRMARETLSQSAGTEAGRYILAGAPKERPDC
jgi:hypothetical protein